jgi:hypothetical protein
MTQTLNVQIAALQHMSPAQVREKYLEVFGEPTRSGNKDFLAKRLAWRIQSLVEGGLTDRARRRAAELARDADIRLTIPRIPPIGRPADQSGTLAPARRDRTLPIPGTVLTRQYRGRLIQVTVLPKGFEWDGQVYRSLSGVAKAVTGSHWNGPLFFGFKAGKDQ